MSSTKKKPVEEIGKSRVKSKQKYKGWKMAVIGSMTVLALIVAGISYYQATRFNSKVTINEIKVGGLTADQTVKKLKTASLKNRVFVGEQQILDEEDTKLGFTEKDLPEVKKLLKNQWTFFPSFKKKDYQLIPDEASQYRTQTMKKLVEEKLLSMNETLKAPVDAFVKLEQGKISISKSKDGEQFDVASLLKDYDKQYYKSDIRLEPVYLQPVREDSEIVKNEEKKLKELLGQSIEYKVQDQVHSLKASELIKSATVSKDLQIAIDPSDIKRKITEINDTQCTLNKNFTFKTHSGKVITVKGQGYGWALDVKKETAMIQKAFETGETSVSAANIIGKGWKGEGYGYETTANNGIGNTYAEVSIDEQRIWIYKNGQLAVTTNVVTGKHSTGKDTSPGVWYILYKRQQYTLTGDTAGTAYAIKVNYWLPFTNSGQGFHDASWRTNWASNAYLNAGSNGCVNVQPNVMKAVYDNLSTYDPVIVY
ncbi:L,D-transpeptidase [Neobacillus niacini]|uniref:L,D-transpeptidase n=1 Tax=Neobacillus niacini TaxID=86668 RepID=UPI0021CB74B4|nr:L,D-transpeptidase [Neobacillus niacini]MCM3764151.1 L,D-transpeptidase [Neobacillus niacini]